MRKLSSIFLSLMLPIGSFAQCDPATIQDMPSAYTKTIHETTPEQVKWINNVFTAVVEPQKLRCFLHSK